MAASKNRHMMLAATQCLRRGPSLMKRRSDVGDRHYRTREDPVQVGVETSCRTAGFASEVQIRLGTVEHIERLDGRRLVQGRAADERQRIVIEHEGGERNDHTRAHRAGC